MRNVLPLRYYKAFPVPLFMIFTLSIKFSVFYIFCHREASIGVNLVTPDGGLGVKKKKGQNPGRKALPEIE